MHRIAHPRPKPPIRPVLWAMLLLLAPGTQALRAQSSDAPAPSPDQPVPTEPSPRDEGPRAPKPGDSVKLIFTSGDAAEGRIVRVEKGRYRVLIGGLEVTVAESDLQDLIILPSLEERFRQMRALIEPDDTESMLALANWAYERALYQPALGVVDDALVHDPRNTDLIVLRDMIRAQIEMAQMRRLREAQRRLDPESRPEEAHDDRAPVEIPRPYPDFPLLDETQINLIKVYEVDLADPPRILIDRSTIDTLLQRYATHPLVPSTREGRDAFRRQTPAHVLDVMFRVRARELYPEVRVVGHPESMRAFRDHVHAGWLINSCATNRCHGGEDARGLILFNRKPTAARAVYTNFLILERYRTVDGQPLIDYQSPDRSVLLQMGLPRADAIFPHPDVVGWAPVFRSRDARGFKRAVRWIEMMYTPRPDYPIEYLPPGSDAPPETPQNDEEPVVR